MIPKTKVLFDLVKKFIIKHQQGISYLKIIEYLDKHELLASISLTTNLWPFYKNRNF